MWDEDGMWRPQDKSLQYTYSQIGDRPTEQERINYIDNLFNATLKRYRRLENFSDLRAELVDHYVSELGDDFHTEKGPLFLQKVLAYHEKFGGSNRIIEMAVGFYKTRRRLMRRQFKKWFLQYSPVHLVFLPLIYAMCMMAHKVHVYIGVGVIAVSIIIFELVKYYHRDRNVIPQIKSGESSVNFFYQFKYNGYMMLYCLFSFHFVLGIEGSTLRLFLNIGTILILYLYAWMYYYHLNICQRRVAPLLEQYRSQLISQTKIA